MHLISASDSTRVLNDAREVLHERGLEHATVQIDTRDSDCSESF